MPIEAKEFRDTVNGKAGYLKRARAGFEALRYFQVNSDLEHVALFAPGLPKIGDPYSQDEELRLCVVTDIGPTERMGGMDRGDGTGGGLTYVPVRYQSLSSVGGGGNEPPRPQAHLDTWCTVRTSLETQPITLPVDEDDVPDEAAAQIMNGEGTTRPAVVCDYLVSVAYDERRGVPDLDRFDALGDPCHTNRGAVTFPPILRTDLRRTKAPGECLYKGYEMAQDGDLLVVTHTIAVRSRGELSWKFTWELKDDRGEVTAIMESRLVPSADWTGLFE